MVRRFPLTPAVRRSLDQLGLRSGNQSASSCVNGLSDELIWRTTMTMLFVAALLLAAIELAGRLR